MLALVTMKNTLVKRIYEYVGETNDYKSQYNKMSIFSVYHIHYTVANLSYIEIRIYCIHLIEHSHIGKCSIAYCQLFLNAI